VIADFMEHGVVKARHQQERLARYLTTEKTALA